MLLSEFESEKRKNIFYTKSNLLNKNQFSTNSNEKCGYFVYVWDKG